MESCIGDLVVRVVEKVEAPNVLKILINRDLTESEIEEKEEVIKWLTEQGVIQMYDRTYSLTELGYQLSVLIEDLIDWAVD